MNKKEIGKLGKDIACKYLLGKKYIILNRNYRQKCGEIDIIVRDLAGFLIFIEVKTRTSNKYGAGYESVDYYKQQKLIKTAYFYLNENKIWDDNFRIDVLSIDLDFKNRKSRVTHLKNAVEEK